MFEHIEGEMACALRFHWQDVTVQILIYTLCYRQLGIIRTRLINRTP